MLIISPHEPRAWEKGGCPPSPCRQAQLESRIVSACKGKLEELCQKLFLGRERAKKKLLLLAHGWAAAQTDSSGLSLANSHQAICRAWRDFTHRYRVVRSGRRTGTPLGAGRGQKPGNGWLWYHGPAGPHLPAHPPVRRGCSLPGTCSCWSPSKVPAGNLPVKLHVV